MSWNYVSMQKHWNKTKHADFFSDFQQPLVALISRIMFPYFVSFQHSNLLFGKQLYWNFWNIKKPKHLGACLIALTFIYNHELKEQILRPSEDDDNILKNVLKDSPTRGKILYIIIAIFMIKFSRCLKCLESTSWLAILFSKVKELKVIQFLNVNKVCWFPDLEKKCFI